MRWWQVGVLAGTVLTYSVLGALSECRLAEVRAERDRLAGRLSVAVRGRDRADGLRDEVRRLKAQVRELDGAPVRGPYPDGMSDERLDPWRPAARPCGNVVGIGPDADPPVRVFEVLGGTMVPGIDPALAGPLVRRLPQPPTAGAEQARRFYP